MRADNLDPRTITLPRPLLQQIVDGQYDLLDILDRTGMDTNYWDEGPAQMRYALEQRLGIIEELLQLPNPTYQDLLDLDLVAQYAP